MKKWQLFVGFFLLSAAMLYLRTPWAVVGLWTVALLTDGAIAYASIRDNARNNHQTARLETLANEVQTLEAQIAGMMGTNVLKQKFG